MDDLLIKVSENEFTASFKDNDISNILVNGKSHKIDILRKIDHNIYSLSVNNKIVNIEFEQNSNGDSTIFLDGMAFNVLITDETRKMLMKYIHSAGGSDSSGLIKIKAPMPGLVVKTMVNIGDHVNKGDNILIIEAMKMENALKAPDSGIVESIKVNEGQTVEKDTLLLELTNK